MTEDEAKQKWCPMARFHVTPDGHVFHNMPVTDDNPSCAADDESGKCIASDCMMWRISTKAGGGLKDDHGYCGLAGKP